MGGRGSDEMSVGRVRGSAVKVEDGGEFVSTRRGQRRGQRIAHTIEDGHDGVEVGSRVVVVTGHV